MNGTTSAIQCIQNELHVINIFRYENPAALMPKTPEQVSLLLQL